ncbi:MAG TPA: hypothetical protein ENI57_11295, partial [Ignavibacteria bacterium]|nr:hypothetical protein [Ignavibacteria bacterium]
MKTDQEKEKRNWSEYCEKTLSKLSPIVEKLGYTLGADQPHLLGERFLIRPIAGGRKLVLVGHRISDGAKVVIKASDEKYGIAELARERLCRNTLEKMRFAYQVFHSPKELAFVRRGGFTIVVTEFIEQDSSFISRPVEKEFALVLAAFKAQ